MKAVSVLQERFIPLFAASCKTLLQLPVMTAALFHKDRAAKRAQVDSKHLAPSDVTNQYGKTSVTSQRADYFQSLKPGPEAGWL